MLVAVDIGNSNVVIGLHDGEEWRYLWRIPTITDGDINFYKLKIANLWVETGIPPTDISQVIVSSVVPELTESVIAFCLDMFSCAVREVGPQLYQDLNFEIQRPHEIGSDLVANAFAARMLFPDSNAVVVDFGTALTFVAVGINNTIHGVSIAPGIQTALRSLNIQTARLPEVPLDFPDRVGGKDTVHAIQSGVLIGYEGLIAHMLTRYRAEFDPTLITLATGGLATQLPDLHRHFDHVLPTLTLDGLRFIALSV
ncbi:MAG: type III pantothenate kinase [Saprospiraceae bacterium]|nr:type III pantothenate kinase [Saprospiraceae bacterium]